MMNFSFSPALMLRTPVYSTGEYKEERLRELLNDQFFRSAIFMASTSMYTELKKVDFCYDLLATRVKYSLQKYFNRMCYRPTPFGLFSAFSSLYWTDNALQVQGSIPRKGKIYLEPDFRYLAELSGDMAMLPVLKYYPNNSVYHVYDESRYITGGRMPDEDFMVASFKKNKLQQKLFKFCSDGKTPGELVDFLAAQHIDRNDAGEFIGSLIETGLLLPESEPNITGRRLSVRLAEIARQHRLTDVRLDEIEAVHQLSGAAGIDIESLSATQLYQAYRQKPGHPFYTLYEKDAAISISKSYQPVIADAMRCLQKISPFFHPAALASFRSRFVKRFDAQEIPLLQALDPELGIGYEDLENGARKNKLLDGLDFAVKKSTTEKIAWSAAHELILARLTAALPGQAVVITDDDLDKLPDADMPEYAPSYAVMFRLAGEKLWIEQAGGNTAVALSARFSLFNDSILQQLRDCAAKEAQLNPGVIFASISCYNQEHADNINTRRHIRDYEIPINTHSEINKENIIRLSDLYVSVINGEVVLRWAGADKRIIPRLDTAYNYSRSGLSVFRFLCDLQYQGILTNFGFEPEHYFPGLSRYPRIEYKNCILSPAIWILRPHQLPADISGLKALAAEIQLSRFFALCTSDNYLVFDLEDQWSLQLFFSCIKKTENAVLKEVFADEASGIADAAGRKYSGQFVASMLNSQPSYKHMLPEQGKPAGVHRSFLPGTEWLYFKLYVHPEVADQVLCSVLKPVVSRLYKKKLISGWFFIRYTDPDHHLRVRIKTSAKHCQAVMAVMQKSLARLYNKGSISNVVIDTYSREIERYGARYIDDAERCFQSSSETVLDYLAYNEAYPNRLSIVKFAVVSVINLLHIFYETLSSRLAYLQLVYKEMSQEYGNTKELKVQLDKKYREYAGIITDIDAGSSPAENHASLQFAADCRHLSTHSAHDTPEQRCKLCADLVHMHLNRLFSSDQRKQEFIIYFLLYKYYKSVAARKENPVLLSLSNDAFRSNIIHKGTLIRTA